MLQVDVVTPQYEDLQTLWSEYKNENLVVLGIPTNNFRQEPGNNKEIKDFVKQILELHFNDRKNNVIGNNSHPFYKEEKIMVLVQYQSGISIRL